MKKEQFFDLLDKYDFYLLKRITKYGEKIFETPLVSDGWMDGYNIKYILTFHSTYGIRFDIDKYSVGGFTGNQDINERLFSGAIDTKEEFDVILKCIRFKEGIL